MGETPAQVRFILADDRVRELLMGEVLYGRRELAVRELYQNALDACRYRAARDTYHGRATVPGTVRLVQGEGFLDCTDDGVGMGPAELSEVFAYAGRRTGDLPDAAAEIDAWRAAGVPYHPNSRFGIGVLSYFMLAEAITVTTCRQQPDGTPGRSLQVQIDGAGGAGEVRDLGPGTACGTTVRLHLRADVDLDAAQVLRRLLWVSSVDVVAVSPDGTELRWSAHQLSDDAPLGCDNPLECTSCTGTRHAVVRPAGDGRVWWCTGQGALLADGLWAGTRRFGAVVDLTGDDAPRLSVDRRSMLEVDEAVVGRLLRAAAPGLWQGPGPVLGRRWLHDLAAEDPALADDLFDAACEVPGLTWTVGGRELPVAVVGCWLPDDELVESLDRPRGPRPGSSAPPRNAQPVDASLVTDPLSTWRAAALADCGALDLPVPVGPWPVARPTDRFVAPLATVVDPAATPGPDGRRTPREVSVGHVLDVAHKSGTSPLRAVERLVQFGVPVPAPATRLPEQVTELMLVAASVDLDAQHPWRRAGDPLNPGVLVLAARRYRCTPDDLVAQMRLLGLEVDEAVVQVARRAGKDDLTLLSRDADGVGPWLELGGEVGSMHVRKCAEKLHWPEAEVVKRLGDLGVTVQVPPGALDRMDPTDRALLDAVSKEVVSGSSLLAGPVLGAATALGLSPAEATARLRSLGLEAPLLPATVDTDDLVALSVDQDGVAPWYGGERPAPLQHVVTLARRFGRTPAQVVERLERLGVVTPAVPPGVGDDDLVLLEDDEDSTATDLASVGHVLNVAYRTRRPAHEVAARLVELGVPVPTHVTWPRTVTHDDLLAASVDVDGRLPWAGTERSGARVLAVAAALRVAPAVAAERLEALGLGVPVRAWPGLVTASDAVLVRRSARSGDWLPDDAPVPVGHAVVFAARTGRTVADVCRRLAELGFPVTGG